MFGLCHLAVMSQKHPMRYMSWWKRKDLGFEGLHVLPRFCGVLPQSKVKMSTLFRVVAHQHRRLTAVRNRENVHKNLYKPTSEHVVLDTEATGGDW